MVTEAIAANMKEIELADQAPCGCGSGDPYIECCKSLAARYVVNAKGRVSKLITPPPAIKTALKEAEDDFRRVFGRKQNREDRLLLVGLRYSPKDYDRQFREIAALADTPKFLIYASQKTGLIVGEETHHRLSPKDRKDWDDAVQEYFDAQDVGIDLLNPTPTGAKLAALSAKDTIDKAVTHLGSYLSRAPSAAGKEWPVFIQQLLVVKCFWYAKCVSDRWDVLSRTETAALTRGVYECSLLLGRINADPVFAETLQAQALAGSELYPYRKKRDGSTDYSKIESTQNGRLFLARNSFKECADKIGRGHIDLFNQIYPLLSGQVHFDALNMIAEFKESGSFLMWDDGDENTTAVLSLAVLLYLVLILLQTTSLTVSVRRDIAYLGELISDALDSVLTALNEDGLGNGALNRVIEALFAVQAFS